MQIFATLDASGEPVALTGSPAALFWQRQDDGSYERSDHQANLGDIAGWDATALALNRIQAVTIADAPMGQVLASYSLSTDESGAIAATPTYAAAPLVVPTAISRMQAQLELHATPSPVNAGKTLLDDVANAIAASTDPTLGIYWNTATDFHRDHPKLNALAAALNLTSAQIDALFVAASQLS